MQPEPSTVSQKAPTESNHEDERPLDQHGLRDDDAAVTLSSADDAGTDAASAEQIAADAALAASLQQGDEPPQATRRVSRKSTPSPPSGLNRITEYEKASTPPVRKREGPAFEVLKKHRSPNDKRSVIQELPNGPFCKP